ncbi:SDR family NAD(P)-dependent oxidoreductase [Belnapia sp. T6]|uniref:SDR family NAD(P)-dependent oxidoreductase n=1 Tax=Belnapia mucosa TaxID=2804532 RepID=A0ABS1UWL6_9PROT|nr:SDR family NAD(P)-dependent oxidoreductase [Belnapia mucosa]
MRHAVVTGASRGLGAAIARRLAAPGMRLGLLARGEAGLAETAAACRAQGALVETARLDVRDAPALAAQLLAWDGEAPIDAAVANAGINGGTRPDGTPEGHAVASAQIAVNLLGAVNLVEPLLPLMLARRRGAIALVGSVAGFRGLPDSPAYSASKAGLWAYGEALRAAHGPAGLRVTVLAPGFFTSAMSATFLGAHPFELPVEAVATRLHRALLRGEGRAVLPWPMGAGLRALALLPAPVSDWMVRRFRFRVQPED